MIVLATGLYWVSIGLVCLAGSALVAHTLRRRGRQERGVWVAGLVGALVLPLTIPLVSGGSATGRSTAGLVAPTDILELAPIRLGVAGAPLFEWLGAVLLSAWVGLSLLLLLRLLFAIRTIGRLEAKATPKRVGGDIVKVTEHSGPAVVGFLRPVVLVPAWVLDLPAKRREWILRHEEEHIRGRDPLLLAFVLAARIAVPWNPVIWWFGTTIRSAIETDCDRRTVGRRGDVRSYGEALLSVAGGRRGPDPLPAMAPAFAERNVPLASRIEAITTPRSPIGGVTRLGLAAVGLITVAAACEMPAPTQVESTVERTVVVEDAVGSDESDDLPVLGPPPPADLPFDTGAEDGSENAEPSFIPYDTPPNLLNAREVMQVLEQAYPPLLKESGIGGQVMTWLWVSETGEVVEARVREDPPGTSGYNALDAAAVEVADAMRFEPAMNGDKAVAVWVQIPITFTVGR